MFVNDTDEKDNFANWIVSKLLIAAIGDILKWLLWSVCIGLINYEYI